MMEELDRLALKLDQLVLEEPTPMRVLKVLAAWLLGLVAITLIWFIVFLALAEQL